MCHSNFLHLCSTWHHKQFPNKNWIHKKTQKKKQEASFHLRTETSPQEKRWIGLLTHTFSTNDNDKNENRFSLLTAIGTSFHSLIYFHFCSDAVNGNYLPLSFSNVYTFQISCYIFPFWKFFPSISFHLPFFHITCNSS